MRRDDPAKSPPAVMAKRVYYREDALNEALARRYYQCFGGARRLLDLGCGIGKLGKYRPDDTIEVYGLDFDGVALAEASQHEIVQPWDLECGRIPFEDNFFDGVLAKDILEHLYRPWQVVEEMWRVLRPGGVVIGVVPLPHPRLVWDDYTHVRGFTRKALRMMFEDAGFEVQSLVRMGGFPLAGRLFLANYIPLLLRLPVLGALYARNWEIIAVKPAGSQDIRSP